MAQKSKDTILSELAAAKNQHAELSKKQKAGTASEAEVATIAELDKAITELSEELKKAVTELKPEVKAETVAEKAAETVAEGEYKVKDDEKHLVHAELTQGSRFDQKTGKEISKPFVQKFSTVEFKQFSTMARSLGYAVKVLHEPKSE